MPWRIHACLFAFASLTAGCAEQMTLLQRGSAGSPGSPDPPEFWPPPGATSLWVSPQSAGGTTLGEAAERIASSFRDAGYEGEHWYPIGVEYAHGFAATTRLERTEKDGAPTPTPERWSPLYPQPATLRWLEGATEMRLPAAGRYRVFFVAFTDLPFGHVAHRAPRWNELTVMAAPAMPAMTFPGARRVPRGYRVGVYVYEYASESPDGEGAFVASDELPATVQIQRSGLSLF